MKKLWTLSNRARAREAARDGRSAKNGRTPGRRVEPEVARKIRLERIRKGERG